MSCESDCLLCEQPQVFKVNFSGIHGLCKNCNKTISKDLQCRICQSSVPILKIKPILLSCSLCKSDCQVSLSQCIHTICKKCSDLKCQLCSKDLCDICLTHQKTLLKNCGHQICKLCMIKSLENNLNFEDLNENCPICFVSNKNICTNLSLVGQQNSNSNRSFEIKTNYNKRINNERTSIGCN